MAKLVPVGDVDIDVDVDVDVDVVVDDYGSTHDEELVVPLTLMVDHPNSHPSWKTKKLMCAGIIGMTAAVASSALVFYSIMDFSKQAQTEESFLLNASSVGADNICVAASGPYPEGAFSREEQSDDDDPGMGGPFVSCFSLKENGAIVGHCWSNSYYADADAYWSACKPSGFGEGWEFDTGSSDDDTSPFVTCGTPCTAFSSDMPT